MSTKQAPATEKPERLRIVVLDDDRLSSHNLSIQLKFAGENPMVATSDNWQQMFNMLAQRNELANVLAIAIGVIKSDSLLDLLLQLHLNQPTLPILLLTPAEGTQLSQLPDTLRALLLPLGDKVLNYTILAAALKTARQLTGHDQPKQQSRVLSPNGTPLFRSLSGDSHKIQQVRQQLSQVSKRPVTVLVTGESGTGKEIVARNLHYHAGRWQKPLIVVNCTAVAHERFDIELFGQEKGFNGNKDGFAGLLEKADGGTLFLDEVSELPPHVQGMLLRFLEDKTFHRIGGHEQLTVDVRVVAGTRQQLQQLMRQGKFREDLYYRLSVVPIELPPLRERREDIPVLLNEIISSLESKGYESVRFNSSAIEALQQNDWPGNVRELANLVERLGIMQPNEVVGSNDLPPQYRGSGVQAKPAATTAETVKPEAVASHGELKLESGRAPLTPVVDNLMLPLDDERLKQYLDNFERQLVEVALDDAAGLIDYAADRVQLDVDSFRVRMQSLNLG
ncbi:MAG TPA: sigma-54 dependent transcriptional regulator [Candidatus Acidoferrum sp.]|nr:sigma-54 dependent transcriptional regulator [Candidatus Acidoferrum sp.]